MQLSLRTYRQHEQVLLPLVAPLQCSMCCAHTANTSGCDAENPVMHMKCPCWRLEEPCQHRQQSCGLETYMATALTFQCSSFTGKMSDDFVDCDDMFLRVQISRLKVLTLLIHDLQISQDALVVDRPLHRQHVCGQSAA